MNVQWPGGQMVRDELDQIPRRTAFEQAHPRTQWDRKGSAYIGHVPYTEDGEERSITIRDNSWRKVLDALEAWFDGDERDTG